MDNTPNTNGRISTMEQNIESIQSDLGEVRCDISDIKKDINSIVRSGDKANSNFEKYIAVHEQYHNTMKEVCQKEILQIVQTKKGIEDVITKTVYDVLDKEEEKLIKKTTKTQKWIHIILIIIGAIVASGFQIILHFTTYCG